MYYYFDTKGMAKMEAMSASETGCVQVDNRAGIRFIANSTAA